MTDTTTLNASPLDEHWLKRYYFLRAGVSIAWVAAAFAAGLHDATIAGLLLLAYPAWDAIANWIDGSRSGGLARNRTQQVNVVASAAATVGVALALGSGMGAVIGVIGLWAIASGLLQLGTAARRWKTHGAQWVMILSGAQSALAGGLFVAQSRMPTPPTIANIAGYAGVGALYFLISGIWLSVAQMRRARRQAA
jgi:uncharacterized membrane protein HdeD (DUF308 family)